MDAAELQELRALVRDMPASSDVLKLAARMVTLSNPRHKNAPPKVKQFVRFGSSPRGGQALILLAKAHALIAGRAWVAEEDLVALAAPALRHRLVLSYEGEASEVHADELVQEILSAAR